MLCRTALMFHTSMFGGGKPDYVGSVDSDEVPVTCYYAKESQASKCDVVLQAAQEGWEAQVDRIGFVAPMPDDDGRLDIYLTTQGTYGGAYTTGPYTDGDSSDGKRGCYAWIAVDATISNAELPGFIVHEFQHVLQYGTDYIEPTLPIWEGVAEAAVLWTYPDYDVSFFSIPDFQADPWAGILADGYMLDDDFDIAWSYYEYGSLAWVLHLDAAYGDGDGSSSRDLWVAVEQEANKNEPDVIDGLDTVTGDWQASLLALSAERTLLGTSDAPEWGAAYTGKRYALTVDDQINGSSLPVDASPSMPPLQTGTAYFDLTGLAAGESIHFAVTSEDENNWGIAIRDGTVTSWMDGPEMDWEVVDGDITVGVVHLGADDFDADEPLRTKDFTLTVSELAVVADDGGGDGGGTGGADTGGDEEPGGCACGSLPRPTGAALGLLVGLLALGRRRR